MKIITIIFIIIYITRWLTVDRGSLSFISRVRTGLRTGRSRAAAVAVQWLIDRTTMDLDADEVERWLCEKAPQDLVDRVIRARLQHRTGSLTINRAKRGSMTSEMFNTWLASSPIKRSRSPNRYNETAVMLWYQ